MFSPRTTARPFRARTLAPLLAGAGLTLSLALSGCASAPADSGDGFRVVATTTQLADFVAEIGGDRVELTALMEPGSSAHHFDPTPAELLEIGRADVLVVNGAGLEGFIDDAIEASGFDGALVDASDGLDLDALAHAGGEDDGHEHGGEEAGHEHAEEDVHDEHAGHDHGPVNPHLWTAPKNAAGMVAEVAEGLAAADPEGAETFRAHAAAYEEQLTALDAWIAENFAAVPEQTRQFVSGHNSLAYYLHDYGITFVGSLLPSFEDNAEPSAAEMDRLIAQITEQGVSAIFVESSMSPKLAEAIGRDAGVTVVTEGAIYADSLGAAGSGADTYITATIENTRLILGAWGATPTPLPKELS
ncbi:metal ABC transporter substrate-binding protein [Leucobacter sp. M11]|uniref:metal ABC transporter substrate-binding protein n=1 Tax=Leucobacter sp. M11 TaxID=2993565 RepID=UPI002D803F57|nr:metal ABC transporter substrate-binding protein [Leucobacter sp. M11]MEB4614857.1 metal ABC transporter substrate-binding protein [Leucobacter sp. M11]